MSIDGVGGPKGPQGPTGPAEVLPADEVQPGRETSRPFTVEGVTSTQPGAPAQSVVDPTVVAAIEGVADELRAGRIAGLDEAFEHVVERIVDGRYPDMPAAERRDLAIHLTDVLADDPVIGARISSALQAAARD